MDLINPFVGGWKVVGSLEYGGMALELIGKILSNDVGMLIISSIDHVAKDVTIRPRTADLIRASNCNAETSPDSKKDSYRVGDRRTLFSGAPYDPAKTGAKDVRFNRVPPGFRGTGKGSSATIFFDADDGGCFDNHTEVSSQYDDILMHELVHALRMAQGLMNYVPTRNHRYDNVEEFIAIVVTSVYISAKGSHRFRADHMGHRLLSQSLSTSAGFIHDDHNFQMLNRFRRDWREMFSALARVQTSFNPFREMIHYPPNATSAVRKPNSTSAKHAGAAH